MLYYTLVCKLKLNLIFLFTKYLQYYNRDAGNSSQIQKKNSKHWHFLFVLILLEQKRKNSQVQILGFEAIYLLCADRTKFNQMSLGRR